MTAASRVITGITFTTDEAKGIFEVEASDGAHLLDLATRLKAAGFDHCLSVTAEDLGDRLAVLWHISSYTNRELSGMNAQIKLIVSKSDNIEVPTLTGIWESANFLERETYEMFGVVFKGHPDMRRLLLPDDFTGKWPMRKDFPLKKTPWRVQK
ncbi:MAG: NADH-quinone oxidoreductase subunit C [Nitrososphaerota archaeon]|nr:NADH-quinone oxidoreductase subunit C [Nitrososphaerota archaeon]